mmetsp:Transcript_54862/g.108880  ORF Transcript_54862/g.108880 Transcript_54862/m.108880 type:complete len:200 (+) Transcript_54862:382-981(+)
MPPVELPPVETRRYVIVQRCFSHGRPTPVGPGHFRSCVTCCVRSVETWQQRAIPLSTAEAAPRSFSTCKCTTPAQTSPTLPSGPSRGLGVARFDWRWKDFGWSSQQQRHRRRCRKGAAARTVGVLERVAGWKEEWAACPWPKLFTESRSPRSTVSWRRCLRQTWVVIVAVAAIVTMTTTVVVVAVAAAAAAAVVRKTRK